MAQVLVAPDKFKGPLSAPQVADCVIRGLRAVDGSVDAIAIPVAAGGEGTAYARRELLAVVEMADASGLGRLPAGGAALAHVNRVDLSGLHPRLAEAEIVVACDVDNPLTGPAGAAAVYGPQKGASVEDVAVLEEAPQQWATALAAATGSDLSDHPGAGAAGGVGLAGLALLGGSLRSGIDLVLELVGFHNRLSGPRLVVTGEGALDAQTLRGKAPVGVALAAASAGAPTVAVCETSSLSDKDLRGVGIAAAYALNDLEPDVDRCMMDAAPLLEQLGHMIALDHLRA